MNKLFLKVGLVGVILGFVGTIHAKEKVCLPEAAKSTAEMAAGLNVMQLVCGKTTAIEMENSRKKIEMEGRNGYPCAKDSFVKWYDARLNEAKYEASMASKDQKKKMCEGLNQMENMFKDMAN